MVAQVSLGECCQHMSVVDVGAEKGGDESRASLYGDELFLYLFVAVYAVAVDCHVVPMFSFKE